MIHQTIIEIEAIEIKVPIITLGTKIRRSNIPYLLKKYFPFLKSLGQLYIISSSSLQQFPDRIDNLINRREGISL